VNSAENQYFDEQPGAHKSGRDAHAPIDGAGARHGFPFQTLTFARLAQQRLALPGANSFARATGEGDLLALHPTVTPVALIADAIMDCSARGDLVLDSFLGSGTTSAVLAFLIVNLAGWDWNALYAEILGLGGFAFAVLSNAVFLGASIRYARVIHPGLHLGLPPRHRRLPRSPLPLRPHPPVA
jgi:DNA methylase